MEVLGLVLLAAALVPVLVAWLGRWRTASVALAAVLLAVVGWIGLVSDSAAASSSEARALVLAVSVLLAIGGGGPLTTVVFGLVDGRTPDDRSMSRAGTVLRGGAWIGALERAAVFATLFAGWPEGLAVVLGVKGLGRYPELRSGDNSGTAERFIIGTFASVLWAVACTGVGWLLA
jgi:hypothetical protein